MNTIKEASIGHGVFMLPIDLYEYLLRFATGYGFTIDELLEISDIEISDYMNKPKFVGNDSYNALLDKLINSTKDPLLPWRYALGLVKQSHGFLEIVLRSSNNISDAFEVLPRLFTTRTGYAQLVETKSDKSSYDVIVRSALPTAPGHIVRFNTIVSIMVIAWWGRIITGRENISTPEDVHLMWPSPESDQITELLPPGMKIYFDMESNFIRYSRDSSKIPVTSSSITVRKMAIIECERLLKSPPEGIGMKDSILWLFRVMKPEIPTIEEAASKLSVSPATLKRRLKAEGTSYQEQKNIERFDQTVQLLVTTDLTIENIAYEVGFDNASNLSKAFRSRFGISPGEFRKANKLIS